MRRDWTLRQVVAIVRGIGVMVGLFWVVVAIQFVPALIREGFGGARQEMVRIAIAGVAQERWEIAVLRMQEALGGMAALACGLYLLQRYLGRQIQNGRGRQQ